jgi:hypothetical protein
MNDGPQLSNFLASIGQEGDQDVYKNRLFSIGGRLRPSCRINATALQLWSDPAGPAGTDLPGLWNATKSNVVFEEKLAGVQCFGVKGRAVGRDEPPMSDLAAQQVDETK